MASSPPAEEKSSFPTDAKSGIEPMNTFDSHDANGTMMNTDGDVVVIERLGYKNEHIRNRSLATLLFQALAMSAIPYGVGGPLISAVIAGGQLPIFVGWTGT